jgi:hypothetical protein
MCTNQIERRNAEEAAKNKKSMWSSFTSSLSSLSSSSSSTAAPTAATATAADNSNGSDKKDGNEPTVTSLPPSSPSTLPSMASFDRAASSSLPPSGGVPLTNVPPSQQRTNGTTNGHGHHHDESKSRGATPAQRIPGSAYGYDGFGDDMFELDDEVFVVFCYINVSFVHSFRMTLFVCMSSSSSIG